MNQSTRHITFEHLTDFIEGRLSVSQRPQVEAHIAVCGVCATQARSLDHLLTLMRSDDTRDAPSHVVNRAARLLRQHHAPSSHVSLRQRLLATLRFDSAQQAPAFALRAGLAASRELLYSAGDVDLEVRIEHGDAGWHVAGQVLGACSGGEVRAQSPAGSATTTLNELCEFSLPVLSEGIYLLLLRLDDVDIEVPGLELGL